MSGSIPTNPAFQDEIAALRQRLADSERALQAAEQRAQLHEAIFQQVPISVAVWHMEQLDDPRSLRLIAANPPNIRTTGFDMSAEMGRRITEIFPTLPEPVLHLYADVVRSGQPRDLGELATPDDEDRMRDKVLAIQVFPLPNNHLCVVVKNITERKRAEALQRQINNQVEMIQAQQAALAELSTPLIPISDEVLVMPLIGAVDSRRAQQVLETLLQGIAGRDARFAILDITGVPVVDTQVANALLHAAQAVRLLGARVVLTGIRPEVAQTLVGLGADLRDIVTRSTLQSGIAYTASRG